jgi:hypothetical protein
MDDDDVICETPIRLFSNRPPVEQYQNLVSRIDNNTIPLLLNELNKKYNNCLSLRENTERIVQIDLEQFFSKQFNNDELKSLIRSITANPDLAIILTNVPDVGDEMLNVLMNSRFGQQSNVRLNLYSQGKLLGTTAKRFSLKYLLDTVSSLSNEAQEVTYEYSKIDGTQDIFKGHPTELSMYYKDISTNRANPGMMETYKNAMPKIIKDLLPYEMNDFCKYVSFFIPK